VYKKLLSNLYKQDAFKICEQYVKENLLLCNVMNNYASTISEGSDFHHSIILTQHNTF